MPLTGALSDRWGRRRVYRIGSVFLLLYSFPAWWMLTLGNLIAVSGGNRVLLTIYMTVLALITTACTFLVPETLRRDLTRLDDAVRVSRDEAGEGVSSTTVTIRTVEW